jgi:hypothetical protein
VRLPLLQHPLNHQQQPHSTEGEQTEVTLNSYGGASMSASSENSKNRKCTCNRRRCICEYESIDYKAEQRRRARKAHRGHHETEILKANRRIQKAAKKHTVTLPFKLVVERSRIYRTVDNSGFVPLPRVRLVNTETGAVIIDSADVDYWAGYGTKVPPPVNPWERPKPGVGTEGPLIRWLLNGADGTPPRNWSLERRSAEISTNTYE